LEGWFFLLLFCVYVLLLVKVVLFSLNWNTSIVYNFCSTYSIPTCCLIVASFTPTLLACCLLASFALAPPIYYISLTCYSPPISASSTYAYFHHHHLLANPLVCLLWASSLPSYLVLPPYLHKSWGIKGMRINL
jgi:hypothetical protein